VSECAFSGGGVSGGGPRLGELNAHEPNRQILYNQSLDERRREPWR
jgi:hypothetical protein